MYIKYMKLLWKVQAKDTEFRGGETFSSGLGMKEGSQLTGCWIQGGRHMGTSGMGNRRRKVMIQKVQCGLKRAVNGLVCLEHKEMSQGQEGVAKERSLKK